MTTSTTDDRRTDRGTAELAEVIVAGRPAVAVRLADRTVIVAARCPHRGAPLVNGTVLGAFLECPWHGATFDLRTGRRLRGPECTDLEILSCGRAGSE